MFVAVTFVATIVPKLAEAEAALIDETNRAPPVILVSPITSKI